MQSLTTPVRPPLTRHRTDRALTGVGAGVARHLGVRPSVVRAVLVVLALCGGSGAVLYAWLWLLMPQEGTDGRPGAVPPARRRLESVLARLQGVGWPGVLGAAAATVVALLAARAVGGGVDVAAVAPLGLLVVGLGLAWMQAGRAGRGGSRRAGAVRVAAGTVLVVISVLALAVAGSGPAEL